MVNLFSPKGLEKYRRYIEGLEKTLTTYQKEVGETTSQGAESWHDNAPYEALRDNIKISDKMAVDARRLLNDAQIREYPRVLSEPAMVTYGVGVIIIRDGKELNLKIVGHGDSNIDQNRILYESPLAVAIMNKPEGETLRVRIGRRDSEIKIKKIYILNDPDLI